MGRKEGEENAVRRDGDGRRGGWSPCPSQTTPWWGVGGAPYEEVLRERRGIHGWIEVAEVRPHRWLSRERAEERARRHPPASESGRRTPSSSQGLFFTT